MRRPAARASAPSLVAPSVDAWLVGGLGIVAWVLMWLGDSTASYGLRTTAAVLVFTFFNLHHYAVDNAIWRSRDGHVRRIVASVRTRCPA